MKTPGTLACVAALLLAGCTTSSESEPTQAPTTSTQTAPTSPPATTPTSAPTVVTSESSTEEIEAQQAVIDFWALLDDLATNPDRELTELAQVARGQALETHRSNLFTQAQQGLTQVGVVGVMPQSVVPASVPNQYTVRACLDVSEVDLLDSEGDSAVAAGRPDQVAYDYTVERDGDRWYVVEDLLEAKDC